MADDDDFTDEHRQMMEFKTAPAELTGPAVISWEHSNPRRLSSPDPDFVVDSKEETAEEKDESVWPAENSEMKALQKSREEFEKLQTFHSGQWQELIKKFSDDNELMILKRIFDMSILMSAHFGEKALRSHVSRLEEELERRQKSKNRASIIQAQKELKIAEDALSFVDIRSVRIIADDEELEFNLAFLRAQPQLRAKALQDLQTARAELEQTRLLSDNKEAMDLLKERIQVAEAHLTTLESQTARHQRAKDFHFNRFQNEKEIDLQTLQLAKSIKIISVEFFRDRHLTNFQRIRKQIVDEHIAFLNQELSAQMFGEQAAFAKKQLKSNHDSEVKRVRLLWSTSKIQKLPGADSKLKSQINALIKGFKFVNQEFWEINKIDDTHRHPMISDIIQRIFQAFSIQSGFSFARERKLSQTEWESLNQAVEVQYSVAGFSLPILKCWFANKQYSVVFHRWQLRADSLSRLFLFCAPFVPMSMPSSRFLLRPVSSIMLRSPDSDPQVKIVPVYLFPGNITLLDDFLKTRPLASADYTLFIAIQMICAVLEFNMRNISLDEVSLRTFHVAQVDESDRPLISFLVEYFPNSNSNTVDKYKKDVRDLGNSILRLCLKPWDEDIHGNVFEQLRLSIENSEIDAKTGELLLDQKNLEFVKDGVTKSKDLVFILSAFIPKPDQHPMSTYDVLTHLFEKGTDDTKSILESIDKETNLLITALRISDLASKLHLTDHVMKDQVIHAFDFNMKMTYNDTLLPFVDSSMYTSLRNGIHQTISMRRAGSPLKAAGIMSLFMAGQIYLPSLFTNSPNHAANERLFLASVHKFKPRNIPMAVYFRALSLFTSLYIRPIDVESHSEFDKALIDFRIKYPLVPEKGRGQRVKTIVKAARKRGAVPDREREDDESEEQMFFTSLTTLLENRNKEINDRIMKLEGAKTMAGDVNPSVDNEIENLKASRYIVPGQLTENTPTLVVVCNWITEMAYSLVMSRSSESPVPRSEFVADGATTYASKKNQMDFVVNVITALKGDLHRMTWFDFVEPFLIRILHRQIQDSQIQMIHAHFSVELRSLIFLFSLMSMIPDPRTSAKIGKASGDRVVVEFDAHDYLGEHIEESVADFQLREKRLAWAKTHSFLFIVLERHLEIKSYDYTPALVGALFLRMIQDCNILNLGKLTEDDERIFKQNNITLDEMVAKYNISSKFSHLLLANLRTFAVELLIQAKNNQQESETGRRNLYPMLMVNLKNLTNPLARPMSTLQEPRVNDFKDEVDLAMIKTLKNKDLLSHSIKTSWVPFLAEMKREGENEQMIAHVTQVLRNLKANAGMRQDSSESPSTAPAPVEEKAATAPRTVAPQADSKEAASSRRGFRAPARGDSKSSSRGGSRGLGRGRGRGRGRGNASRRSSGAGTPAAVAMDLTDDRSREESLQRRASQDMIQLGDPTENEFDQMFQE